MAVSGDGRHALLASRRLLVLVDLQRPEHHLRALSWHSKYDAGSAAWSRAPAQGGADLAVTVSPPLSRGAASRCCVTNVDTAKITKSLPQAVFKSGSCPQ